MLLHKCLRRLVTSSVIRICPSRTLYTSSNHIILGIETSCDDTGCAVIDGSGNILGESLYSQNAIHTKYGGVNPLVAKILHRENIEPAVAEALNKADKTIKDVDAIAVTTKPGLLISLQVGVRYAKYLARMHSKPLIPIHHMEAHALIARKYHDLEFPFLVLLISGGHCLLALAKDVDEFVLLGKGLDNAPGEVLDKVARRMKLKNRPEYSRMSGGRAVELAASKASNPGLFEFPLPLARVRDCNFSFSGLKDSLERKLIKKEFEHQAMGCELIPEVNDLCAAFQTAVAEHLVHRTHRAIMFCEKNNLITPNHRKIVVSGGVACNNFIFKSIEYLANQTGYKAYRPPPQVCTDNGVMIAWNGLEKLRKQYDAHKDICVKDIDPTAPLGKNLVNQVKSANISTKVTRLKHII
ncbi:tRNA N6-adenosine threonylcarbamoyltransferase, mitochondrial-like [Anticarsia gemmatalis]|uniref:tRNA N6-adenosine threonylcarbamoyltransferase, mitochondrial-like n=1 Tax=Anticarsia gemmatalis TaxID=129554 RepID=UPI003F76148C